MRFLILLGLGLLACSGEAATAVGPIGQTGSPGASAAGGDDGGAGSVVNAPAGDSGSAGAAMASVAGAPSAGSPSVTGGAGGASEVAGAGQSDGGASGAAASDGGAGGAAPAFQFLGVVADGDSLTDPNLGITTWATLLSARCPVTNFAIGGSTILTMAKRDAAFNMARAPRTVGIRWAGTNDTAKGTPAATSLANMAADIAKLRAAGWTKANGNPLVGINMLPRNSAGFPQAERTAFNEGFIGLDFDDIVDVSAGPPGSPGDGVNYTLDFVHLKDAGQQWIYDNKIEPLLSSITF
jgi:hypothetical protein